jgi:hypothetical protein
MGCRPATGPNYRETARTSFTLLERALTLQVRLAGALAREEQYRHDY